MIIDCFTFFNEFDMLEVRLNQLNNFVDYFVLVEASKTQSLIDKPFYFDENKNRFETFLNKIIHIKLDSYPTFNNVWGMENFQRNKIVDGIKLIPNLKPDDIVLISDLDEIPNENSIEQIKNSNEPFGSLKMDFRAYFLNFKAERCWIGTVYVKAIELNKKCPQDFRNSKDHLPLLNNGEISGWHLSWMGGVKQIWEKSFSCIEPFDKSEIPPFEEFESKFYELISRKKFIHIENLNKLGENFLIDNNINNLPKYVIDNLKKFDKLFL